MLQDAISIAIAAVGAVLVALSIRRARSKGAAAALQQAAVGFLLMGASAIGIVGFLGLESARGGDGFGITVSYWRDEAAILAWKRDAEHAQAQRGGRETWYEHYEVRVAKVERAYGHPPA